MTPEEIKSLHFKLVASARITMEAELGLRAPDPYDFFPKTAEHGLPQFGAGDGVAINLTGLTKMDPREGFPFGAGDLPQDYISALITLKGEYSWSAVS